MTATMSMTMRNLIALTIVPREAVELTGNPAPHGAYRKLLEMARDAQFETVQVGRQHHIERSLLPKVAALLGMDAPVSALQAGQPTRAAADCAAA